MAVMKTPGVYIVEKNAFPNSVVEVATAVPAFIGYTEKADNGGVSLKGKPWRIASMAEYVRYFGGPPEPKLKLHMVGTALATTALAAAGKRHEAATKLVVDSMSALGEDGKGVAGKADELKQAIEAAQGANATEESKKKPAGLKKELADLIEGLAIPDLSAKAEELRHAKEAAKAADATEDVKSKPVKLEGQLEAWRKATEAIKPFRAAQANLAMAKGLLAASVDAAAPSANMDTPRAQVTEFELNEKKYRLTRAAGAGGNRFLMHQAMRHFFQNGGGPCYVVSVGGYVDENDKNTANTIAAGDEKSGLISGITPLIKEQEPTMVVVPDAVSLPRKDCISVQTAMLSHCGYVMKSRVAILDVWGGDLDRQDKAGSCIDKFRDDIGINFLDFAAAYYPWLHTSLLQASDFRYWMVDSAQDLAAIVWDELRLADADADDKRSAERIRAVQDLTKSPDQWAEYITGLINDSSKSDTDKAKAIARLADSKLRKDDIAPHRMLLDKSLLAMSELYTKIRDEALEQLNLMPPSAAMAGLYTMVDNTRGVWKAPANVSVAGVVRPAVEISHADQEDLNVTTQGKSINAIRSFIGEGALVWGARTLDGNSLDWRYINVRRTMIMLEESCRLAAKALVFEPNVANTWVTIKSMIGNFLTGIWKRGGLAGAVPEDAFSVHVGLGETMTPEDILEGILRVTVLVAISRPAEFIEITFQQQMQKS